MKLTSLHFYGKIGFRKVVRKHGNEENMLPEAFLERMRQMLQTEYGEFLASYDCEKHQALRLNGLKYALGGVCATELSDGKGFAGLSPVSWTENGYYYTAGDQPGKHPYHEAGVYYIQEPSAMAPAELLGVKPGERVLDLCAAPGGKSTQLAAKLQGKGFLLCNEIHPARARILSENVERLGIRNACVTNETAEHLAELFPGFFDKILVDAPCSGEGMFRKNEAACEEWSPENVKLCAARQDEILDCAAGMLRAGGRLVYSTCTFAPAENEGSISRFLARHPEFFVINIDKTPFGEADCDGVPAYIDCPAEGLEGTLRLWPHRVRGEGHYAALLGKAGDTVYAAPPANGYVTGLAERELEEYAEFAREQLRGDMQAVGGGCFIRFGDNLYQVPEEMPSLKGLRVLRPGLHIGEIKKKRFEPSHALALALRPEEAGHILNLASADARVEAYLKGQTFPAEGEKGWYLICVDGFSLGWGKLAGGIMKNHYPKGLRR